MHADPLNSICLKPSPDVCIEFGFAIHFCAHTQVQRMTVKNIHKNRALNIAIISHTHHFLQCVLYSRVVGHYYL